MAFDGGFLHKIAQELEGQLGARIDRINQPTRASLVITLRGAGRNQKLLLSVDAAAPRLHFVEQGLENPQAPPMFCMLLRKHLGSGRLVRVEQQGLDRLLRLGFETVNELGDRVELTLICEIMGRHSNLILVGPDGKVIDAIKRVDFVTSEARQVLPGLLYSPPPFQHKLNPAATAPEQLVSAVCGGRDIPLSKALLEQIEGLSPLICREISAFVFAGGVEQTAGCLNPEQTERLRFYLGVIRTALKPDGGTPVMLLDGAGKAMEFSYLPLHQFPEGEYRQSTFASYSALLDAFYQSRDRSQQLHQRTNDLRKLLANARDRLRRKLVAQQQELETAGNRRHLRQWGDIISANLYRIEKGDVALRAVDFFSETQQEIEIPLDPLYTPIKNAQKYYNEYKKYTHAEQVLREQMEKGEGELRYVESALDQLDRVQNEAEIEGVRQELVSQGYCRPDPRRGKKPVKLAPRRYRSSDGFLILCGRNNLQNDQLTLRDAKNYDLWLHVQREAGSHAVVVADGAREIPNRTIEEAAVVAATNSSVRQSGKVAVDYTYIKNVKKPRGARPGMVVYESYRTAVVTPDEALCRRLEEEP